jgi:hypothetical protein
LIKHVHFVTLLFLFFFFSSESEQLTGTVLQDLANEELQGSLASEALALLSSAGSAIEMPPANQDAGKTFLLHCK